MKNRTFIPSPIAGDRPLLSIPLYTLYTPLYELLYFLPHTSGSDIMQPQESPGPTNRPTKPPGEPRGSADAPAPHREEHTIHQYHHSLSAHIMSLSPEFRMVAGMAVMMILLLATLCSVSSYVMSARISGMVLAVFLVFFAYSIVVAARCRRRPTGTMNPD